MTNKTHKMRTRSYEYAFKFLLWALAIMPYRMGQSLAWIIGRLLYGLPNKAKGIALKNIQLCFPEKDKSEQQQLLKKTLIELVKTIIEAGVMWFSAASKTKQLIREIEGEHLMEAGLAEGKGIIIAGPHLGAWEMVGIFCGARFSPMTSLYRTPKPAWLDKIIRQSRQRSGAELVQTDTGGIRKLYKALAKNQVIGILPDHEASIGSGVFVPFFNIICNTPVLLPKLAKKSGAKVIYCVAQRLPWGRGFKIVFTAASDLVYAEDLLIAAKAVNDGVEACVRRTPEQYQWNYKRFRSRPDGGDNLY